VYIGHYMLVGWYAITQTTWSAEGRMRRAAEMIGNEPRYVAIIVVVFGVLYIIRAEFRERRNSTVKANGFDKANAATLQRKNEELEKETWRALTLLQSGKIDEAKAIVEGILKS